MMWAADFLKLTILNKKFYESYFFNLSLGVAENLCKLFVTDNGIDMTPILRRSKESARRQRSRPEAERSQDIPNTRPLAERARPTLPNRKRPFQRYYYFYFSLFRPFFQILGHTIYPKNMRA